ncbi:hemerythrin domain-containing protein [Legionella septentrionalis]|uniref:hemerythrin domain-containing protein n=1 Tax=Legionella septentrionalis TaxID=2498109 RepID=UPI000F8ED2C1|nr:hemerythrin domain-containing protein [Legionella septentrionalis]RUR02805.1 hemerythrin domain-containing protein [Legionella septentrionalis]RUR11403.1 hemerythrin domain-containing protein [Legionella septentrionalis]
MNAIDFLIQEHQHARKMFADIIDPSHRFETQLKLFDELAQTLIRHEKMEQTVWYPHFKDELPDMVKHLLKEERHAEQSIEKINKLKTEEAWKKHFQQLREDVDHHATEEEEELFPQVKKLLDEEVLLEIGKEMRIFKKEHVG